MAMFIVFLVYELLSDFITMYLWNAGGLFPGCFLRSENVYKLVISIYFLVHDLRVRLAGFFSFGCLF